MHTFALAGCGRISKNHVDTLLELEKEGRAQLAAAATKPFGFVPFYPGPGVGGHCIPIDPYYLTWKARAHDYHTRLIEMAGDINDEMPAYVVTRLQDLLNDRCKPMKGSRVLLLGVAYKGDIDDLRESPALKVWDELEHKGAAVDYFDPYCPKAKRPGGTRKSIELTPEALAAYDAVIVTSAHKKGVDYSLVEKHAPLVLDTKNVYGGKERENIVLL